MVRVAINGYGRIGRVAHRVISQWHSDEIEVVAINVGHSTDLKGWMNLLKFDSVYGLFPFEVSIKPNPNSEDKVFLGHLVVDGKEIPIYSQKDPTALPWKDLNVDVVLEATGAFTSKEKAGQHLTAGAKKVVISAPGKDGDMPTFVISVNDADYKNDDAVVSNASCTSNCITPVAKVIEESFGIEKAMMTTIHAYTSDQEIQDGGHGDDYRRSRAAALNIVPTSTGATIAAGQALPALKGIFAGLSIRVPVPVGSLSDFTFLLKRDVTVEEVNNALKQAAEKPEFKGILAVSEDPLVSSDIIGNSHSSIVDLPLTQVVSGNMLKIIAWYDNEYGYANRLVEMAVLVGEKGGNVQGDEAAADEQRQAEISKSLAQDFQSEPSAAEASAVPDAPEAPVSDASLGGQPTEPSDFGGVSNSGDQSAPEAQQPYDQPASENQQAPEVSNPWAQPSTPQEPEQSTEQSTDSSSDGPKPAPLE